MDNNIRLTKTEWKEGIMDVIDFLRVDMIQFLQDEGRYFGRVKSYMNNLRDSLSDLESQASPEVIDKYGRVLGIIRSTIYSEFKRLGQRRLSPADRVIVLIRKLLELDSEIEPDTEFKYQRELGSLKRVIDKLFDNIGIRGKNDGLYKLTELIQSSASAGAGSKFICDSLDLYKVEHPKPKVKTLDGPETLLNSAEVTMKEVEL